MFAQVSRVSHVRDRGYRRRRRAFKRAEVAIGRACGLHAWVGPSERGRKMTFGALAAATLAAAAVSAAALAAAAVAAAALACKRGM